MPTGSAISSLEQGYDQFCGVGGLGSDELYQLGALAGGVAAERRGPHKVVAYILRSVFLDISSKIDGSAITPNMAGSFFTIMDPPIRSALASLKAPMAVELSVTLAERLLDARSALIDQIGDVAN